MAEEDSRPDLFSSKLDSRCLPVPSGTRYRRAEDKPYAVSRLCVSDYSVPSLAATYRDAPRRRLNTAPRSSASLDFSNVFNTVDGGDIAGGLRQYAPVLY